MQKKGSKAPIELVNPVMLNQIYVQSRNFREYRKIPDGNFLNSPPEHTIVLSGLNLAPILL